jgi:hypothetical protein
MGYGSQGFCSHTNDDDGPPPPGLLMDLCGTLPDLPGPTVEKPGAGFPCVDSMKFLSLCPRFIILSSYNTLFENRMNRKLIFMAIAVGFTIQCSLFHKRQGPTLPVGSRAMLQSGASMDVYVFSIDGKRVTQSVDNHHEFTSGVHTFTFRFHKKKKSSDKPIPNSTEFDLSIDAKVGKIYQVEYKKSEDSSRWSTCIIDVSNGNRVSSIITNED